MECGGFLEPDGGGERKLGCSEHESFGAAGCIQKTKEPNKKRQWWWEEGRYIRWRQERGYLRW